MNDELTYYKNIIKPVEKKYTIICFLYATFKFKWLKTKKQYYNYLLSGYYKMLLENKAYAKNLEEQLK